MEISTSNSINFEFQKGNGVNNRGSHHRMALGKPTPSKWDDAQKWLVGLSRSRERRERSHHGGNAKPRNSNADDRRLIAPVPQLEDDSSSTSPDDQGMNKSSCSVIANQDEGETKNVDSSESFWRINKPSGDSILGIRSVSVRDMGTEMTPIASLEPSRTGTPIRASTPAATSPISSRSEASAYGRTSNASRWTNREERESNASKISNEKNSEHARKPDPLEIRAIAWDEAERAKYMARYKREEVKIQAWENHEKRKAEMEMKRIEVKAERLKARAQEKMVNKLAATRRIAEEKRANAEAKLNEQAARTSERADYMRRAGHLPSSFSFKMPSLCW
ncbi:hypothetical protein Syun_024433 [Stephania yunnanensis]|uniref:Remorin C-terminal domain-containing protein n=1 Tax=Stephania yunnanensis TaxID=152371 RepID=A0AAP0I4C8_9MAGN